MSAGPSTRSPARDPAADDALEALLDELADRWERGERPRAEAYLARLPAAPGGGPDPGAAVALVYLEFCRAEAAGLAPDPARYQERFPTLRERLGRLLDLHAVIAPDDLRRWASSIEAEGAATPDGGPELPESGDVIGPYRLGRELGRGGFGRVFLAAQTDLADRPVVVKLTTRAGGEPQLLARARHPHIVEVLQHAETADGRLHLISMPFLGGATLAAVLAALPRSGARRLPRRGRALVTALDRVAAPEFPRPGPTEARTRLAAGSHPQAVAWLVARLAQAIAHAHRRGVSHGDLKPSNVLIAADGRPMLLDFGLAVAWGGSHGPAGPDGGTPLYLPPERLRDLADPAAADPPAPVARHRADIYSLGLLLREALTGQAPAGPPRGRLDRQALRGLAEDRGRGVGVAMAAIPAGLRPILARALDPDPAARYDDADALAEDLDRWAEDRRTRHARPPAWPHRLARVLRRRRRPLAVLGLALAVAAVVGLGMARQARLVAARQASDRFEALFGGREPGVYRFRPLGYWQPVDPDEPARLALIHLARYGLAPGPAGTPDWRRRPDVLGLPAADRDDLELWLLEQTWRLAGALADRPDAPDDWRRALAIAERDPAWAALGPLQALRADLRRRLALPPAADPAGPAPDPMLARFLEALAAEPDRADVAQAGFAAVARGRPGSFWPHYRAAAVAHRRRDADAAVAHLEACLRRRPGCAPLHAQLAACLYGIGRDRPGGPELTRALAESERAVALDAELAEAYRGRSYARFGLGQAEAGAADLTRFALLQGHHRPAAGYELRTQLRLYRLQGPPGDLERHLDQAPPDIDPTTRVLLACELFEFGRTAEAFRQLDLAVAREPENLLARYVRGMRHQQQGAPAQAAADFGSIVVNPRFDELVATMPQAVLALYWLSRQASDELDGFRGLALARQGLELATRHGQPTGPMHYALALAYAQLARSTPGLAPRIDAHLEAAVAAGLDDAFLTAAADPAFAPWQPPGRTAMPPPAGPRAPVGDGSTSESP